MGEKIDHQCNFLPQRCLSACAMSCNSSTDKICSETDPYGQNFSLLLLPLLVYTPLLAQAAAMKYPRQKGLWLCQVKIKAALVTLTLCKGSATAETPLSTNQKGGKKEDQHSGRIGEPAEGKKHQNPKRMKKITEMGKKRWVLQGVMKAEPHCSFF